MKIKESKLNEAPIQAQLASEEGIKSI